MSLLDLLLPQYSKGLQDLYDCLDSINDARYAMAAMLALQLYEWLALLDKEIDLIYKSRLTKINVAYLLCRYYPAALWIVLMWAIVGDHPTNLCLRVVKPVNALLAPCQFISQGIMMMRAYAFTSRDYRVLVLLGFCYAILVGINIWVFCTNISVPVELYAVLGETGCFPNYGLGFMALRIGYTILAATLMDLVSLTVVLVYCYKCRAREVSLGRYFVNQGLIAFAFVCVINIICVASYFRPPSYRSGTGLPMILVLPNIVACRVILQLRSRCLPSDTEISRRNSRLVREALITQPSDAWTIQ